jgi:hypothetical protein
MKELSLKPTQKAILAYYSQLAEFKDIGTVSEGSLAPLFAELLKHCAKQFEWTLVEQYPLRRSGKNLRADGALIAKYNLIHGIWEAKDSSDNLEKPSMLPSYKPTLSVNPFSNVHSRASWSCRTRKTNRRRNCWRG